MSLPRCPSALLAVDTDVIGLTSPGPLIVMLLKLDLGSLLSDSIHVPF